MIKKFLLVLLILIPVFSFSQQSRFTLSGYIREDKSSELLIGVNVYIPALKTGTQSNTYGFYSITIPEGKYQVIYSYVGYKADTLIINLDKSVSHNVNLLTNTVLSTVEIRASLEKRISQDVQMSSIDIPIQQIKSLPAFFGERDIFKTLKLMPGIQKGTEGSSGVYVRGGGPDQNLIILDDAIVYNASHLFGFFSIFNGDAIKSVELMKGGFPARYGGRLSSVIEMNMKDGNKKEIEGEAGIGLISSRLTLEGPLVKDKSSFLVSGRRTYIDLLIRPFMNTSDGVGGYYFYDFNAKANWDFSDKNKLYISGYFGRDKFYTKYKITDPMDPSKNYTDISGFFWQNATSTLRWNHLFNNRLFSNTSLIYSNYNMVLYDEAKGGGELYKLRYLSGIRDFSLKSDFSYFPNPEHHIRYGVLATQHRFRPSAFTVKTNISNESISNITKIDVFESGLYIEDEARLGQHFRLNPGLRLTGFITSKKSYFAAEPRLNSSFILDDLRSIKASFAMMNQYIHLLSNTGLGLPTDLWVPSSNIIKPQRSQQIALGYAQDIPSYNLTFSVEGYYKWMKNIIGYREGASFLIFDDPASANNHAWEDNVTSGKGWSTGIELLLQRKTGRLSGWIGYTLSWTKQQFDELNYGKEFYAGYDRRHDVSIVGIYEISKRITLSGTWVFSSGNATTLPTSTYSPVPAGWGSDHMPWYNSVSDYGEKNSFRMPSYHRLDLSVQFHKKIKKGLRTFEIGLYNAYNRRNPFYYFLEGESDMAGNQKNVLKQISLFPVIPSITYSIKF